MCLLRHDCTACHWVMYFALLLLRVWLFLLVSNMAGSVTIHLAFLQGFLKGVSRRARYMALPHREELLELALDAFAVGKNQRMHDLLLQASDWFSEL